VVRARVIATDISKAALDVARRNAERHAVLDRVSFIQADLLNGFRKEAYFHVILSNPPYVSCAQFEGLQEEVREGDPLIALVSGPNGIEHYPPLINRSMELLVRNGNLMVEVGAGQAGVVAGMFEGAGFKEVAIVNDFSGIGRVVRGKKKNA
jgi:release factor glutamine methyltransferase